MGARLAETRVRRPPNPPPPQKKNTPTLKHAHPQTRPCPPPNTSTPPPKHPHPPPDPPLTPSNPQAASTLLLLDGHKQVEGVLSSGRLDVLKLNAHELSDLTGEADVSRAARQLFQGVEAPLRRPGALLAVTNGSGDAMLYGAAAAWRLRVPRVEALNAVGAGDVTMGVFVHSLARLRGVKEVEPGLSAEADAFAWGLAAGSARCLSQLPEFEPRQVRELRSQIVIEPLPNWTS